MNVNHVVIIGNLTRDPEVKFTQSGTCIVKFAIANNQRKKVGDTWEDEAHFFDVTMMGKGAEAVEKYLSKGKQVAIEGLLKQNRWETPEGEKRSKIEIFCQNLQLLGSKQNEQAEDHFEDDVPF